MFVRKKSNSSGKTCVQVIDKVSGKYKVAHTIGSSSDAQEVAGYVAQAKAWIQQRSGLAELDFTNEETFAGQILDRIERLQLVGLELLLGRVFDEIGFGKVDDPIFRQLVISRLAYPKSKLKTTEYLSRYQQVHWSEDQVYRYLDKLYRTQKDLVQQISYRHTLQVLGNQVSIVFYDVTTLYFEIDNEDGLRKTGFSKDGRPQHPQIVLGLLVSKNGYPLAYEVFEGNKFEGHTMLPVIDAFRTRYNLQKVIVIADSGLLSKANIEELSANGYEFIIGARIKNETHRIREKILSLGLTNGQSTAIKKGGYRLIITHSDGRAKKDKYNREKGLRRLEKQIKTGRLTKASINNRGYNKYLRLEGEVTVAIDHEKYEQDARWDGLKGYLTNSALAKDQIIENYQHLWQIEKAFRVAKADLKIRPIYHRIPRRIEAHICICFVAYKVYKELERQLKAKKASLSPEKAIEIALSIFEVTTTTPKSKKTLKKLLLLSIEQRDLARLFGF